MSYADGFVSTSKGTCTPVKSPGAVAANVRNSQDIDPLRRVGYQIGGGPKVRFDEESSFSGSLEHAKANQADPVTGPRR